MYEHQAINIETVRGIKKQIRKVQKDLNTATYRERKLLSKQLEALLEKEREYKVVIYSKLAGRADRQFNSKAFDKAEEPYRRLLELGVNGRDREEFLDRLAQCCENKDKRKEADRYRKRSRKAGYQLIEKFILLHEFRAAEDTILWLLHAPKGEFNRQQLYLYAAKCYTAVGMNDFAERARLNSFTEAA